MPLTTVTHPSMFLEHFRLTRGLNDKHIREHIYAYVYVIVCTYTLLNSWTLLFQIKFQLLKSFVLSYVLLLCQMPIFFFMFQSAIKTPSSVGAFKNWTSLWGIRCMESLHTVCQTVSEFNITFKCRRNLVLQTKMFGRAFFFQLFSNNFRKINCQFV